MSRKILLNASEIIKRAKQALNLKTDLELAALLNIKHSTLSSWKTRGSIDLVSIVTLCNNVSTDWLIYGIGSPDPTGMKVDRVTEMIVTMLEDMTEDQKRDVLKNLEKEKFILEMMGKYKTGTDS